MTGRRHAPDRRRHFHAAGGVRLLPIPKIRRGGRRIRAKAASRSVAARAAPKAAAGYTSARNATGPNRRTIRFRRNRRSNGAPNAPAKAISAAEAVHAVPRRRFRSTPGGKDAAVLPGRVRSAQSPSFRRRLRTSNPIRRERVPPSRPPPDAPAGGRDGRPLLLACAADGAPPHFHWGREAASLRPCPVPAFPAGRRPDAARPDGAAWTRPAERPVGRDDGEAGGAAAWADGRRGRRACSTAGAACASQAQASTAGGGGGSTPSRRRSAAHTRRARHRPPFP